MSSPTPTVRLMPRDLSRDVAAEIRRLIKERSWSGRELSRRSGIPQPSISRKLADVHPFDLDDLDAICAVLEVQPAELVAWAERVEQIAGARDRMAASLELFASLDARRDQ